MALTTIMRMLSLAFVGALASAAHAQPGAPTVALDVFLEQRVAEELAADGTILSRLGVALDVEIVGDKLLVSLVDPATRRAVASTKVDAVPADREAAVAQVTQVASNLASQLGRTAPQTGLEGGMVDELRRQREARSARDAGEYQYRQEALGFGREIAVTSTPHTITVETIEVPIQGETRRKLGGPEFYTLVGRPDLADAYSRRRTFVYVGIGVTVATWAAGLYALTKGLDTYDRAFCGLSMGATQCEANEDARERAFDADRRPYQIAGVGLFVGGVISLGVAGWFHKHPHPVSTGEVHSLAIEHNRKLRQKYDLPVTHVQVGPYADERGGGMLVSGRF